MAQNVGDETSQTPSSKNVRIYDLDHSALNSVKAQMMLESGKPTNLQEAFQEIMRYYTKHKLHFDIDQAKVDEALQDVQDIES